LRCFQPWSREPALVTAHFPEASFHYYNIQTRCSTAQVAVSFAVESNAGAGE